MIKVNLVVFILSTFSVIGCNAQNTEITKIENVITAFSKAGDNNNSKELETYLDDNYRVVMNRLFGSESVSTLNKTIYLEKIKTKEYGGDNRELTIESVVINGTTASAKVTFKGSKMTFVSILVLIQDYQDNWKLVSDIPTVK